jgi:hypothetical protein
LTIAPAVALAVLAFYLVALGSRGFPVHLVRRGFEVAAIWFFISIVLGGAVIFIPVSSGGSLLQVTLFLSTTSFATGTFIGFRAVLDLFGRKQPDAD